MKNTTITLAVSAALNTLLVSNVSAATDADLKESALLTERILVTANRTQEDSYSALSSHAIITSEDIARLQPQNVTELLDKVAGISVANNGGAGQTSSIFMRGTNSNHILVLVDGVRVSSATTGQANYAGITSAQIERIEVIKGPRAALWGSDAIGGVIQIFTKQFNAGEGVVSASLGSNAFWQVQGAVGLGNDQHNVTLSLSAEETDGFDVQDSGEDDDDGYDRLSFSVNAKSQLTDSFSLGLVANLDQGGSDYDSSYGSDENEFDNHHVKVATQYQGEKLFTELSVMTSENESKSFGNGRDKADADVFTTERDQVAAVLGYQFSDHTNVTMGADWYEDDIKETSAAYPVKERDVTAFYLQGRHDIANFMLEAAVRYDDIENVDEERTYNTSIGYRYRDTWVFSVNRGTAFRAPSFNDLYYPENWGYVGNPDVSPESSTTNEILIRNALDNAVLEIAFYQTDIDNLINWQEGDDGLTRPTNILEAEIKGAELTATITQDNWQYQGYFAYVKSEDAKTDKALLRRPEFSANYNIAYQWEKFSFDAAVNYRDDSMDFGDVKLSSYWLLDLGMAYTVTQDWSVSLRINNVTDKDYENVSGYNADGVNGKLTTRYTF